MDPRGRASNNLAEKDEDESKSLAMARIFNKKSEDLNEPESTDLVLSSIFTSFIFNTTWRENSQSNRLSSPSASKEMPEQADSDEEVDLLNNDTHDSAEGAKNEKVITSPSFKNTYNDFTQYGLTDLIPPSPSSAVFNHPSFLKNVYENPSLVSPTMVDEKSKLKDDLPCENFEKLSLTNWATEKSRTSHDSITDEVKMDKREVIGIVDKMWCFRPHPGSASIRFWKGKRSIA